MTHLRKMMLEELERRNYAQTTIDCYIQTIGIGRGLSAACLFCGLSGVPARGRGSGGRRGP